MREVKAMFTLQSLGEDEHTKQVELDAVTDEIGDAKYRAFWEYTPSGHLSLGLDKEAPAADFFDDDEDVEAYELTIRKVYKEE